MAGAGSCLSNIILFVVVIWLTGFNGRGHAEPADSESAESAASAESAVSAAIAAGENGPDRELFVLESALLDRDGTTVLLSGVNARVERGWKCVFSSPSNSNMFESPVFDNLRLGIVRCKLEHAELIPMLKVTDVFVQLMDSTNEISEIARVVSIEHDDVLVYAFVGTAVSVSLLSFILFVCIAVRGKRDRAALLSRRSSSSKQRRREQVDIDEEMQNFSSAELGYSWNAGFSVDEEDMPRSSSNKSSEEPSRVKEKGSERVRHR